MITTSQTRNTSQAFVIANENYIFAGMSHVNYVNSIMREINDMTDDIYESLIDSDHEDLNKNIQRLIKILRDISKSHESE